MDELSADMRVTIAESEVEAGVIWVGTDDGNVQISRDDGASWSNVRDRVGGLPAETWREDSLEIELFEAEVFGDAQEH